MSQTKQNIKDNETNSQESCPDLQISSDKETQEVCSAGTKDVSAIADSVIQSKEYVQAQC